GAGKTTILRILAGLLKSTSGKITYSEKQEGRDFRETIGYLPQYPTMHGWMTGLEYLLYCAQLTYLPKKEAETRAHALLERVGISEARNKRIQSYSGGMKQRLGIAQALIHQPALLMLDEPVSALDPLGRREILSLLEKLKEETTILFSTHILSDADEISDELLLLHQGNLVESGSLHLLRKKYQVATIALEIDGDLTALKEKVEKIEGVTSTHIQRDRLHLAVTSIEEVRDALFEETLGEQWPVTHFSINKASLEDMFMKAVQR